MKKITYKSLIIFSVSLIVLLFSYCNKNQNKNSEMKKIMASDKANYKPPKNIKRIKKFPPSGINPNKVTITEIDIQPELPFTDSILTFNLNIKTELKEIKPYYLYYVNNHKVKESYENTLSGLFKKDDLVFADIIILQNEKEITRVRSNIIKILNSNPVIEDIILPKIIIPGEYKIKVMASDSDNEDENLKLSIETEDNMPSFIIDQYDKTITLNLTKDDFGKIYKFFIKVEDKDGGFAKKEIVLKLIKKVIKREIKQKPKVEKKNKQKKKNIEGGITIKRIKKGGIGY